MASSGWHTINFILAFIAFIIVIILIFMFIDDKNRIKNIPWTVQLGTLVSAPIQPINPPLEVITSSTTVSGTINNNDTDTMVTGGKNIYVNRSNMDIKLVISNNDNNVVGTHIAVTNQGTGNITLIGDKNVILSPSSIVVEPKEHLEMIMLSPGTFTLLFKK